MAEDSLRMLRGKHTPTPVLFTDLDGTIRWGKDELGRFVNGPNDVRVFDGMVEILTAYRIAGWRIVGVTNQGGIALGLVTLENAIRANAVTYEKCGRLFDKISMCSHHPDAADPEMAVCWCRKPRIGMIIESCLGLAEVHRECYPPHLALFVGDRPEDEQCAANAGIQFMDAKRWREGGWRETLGKVKA